MVNQNSRSLSNLALVVISVSSVLAIAALVLLLPGCSSSTSGSGSGTVSFATVYSQMFAPTTAADCASCHAGTGTVSNGGSTLDMSTESAAYTALTTTYPTATDESANCGSVKLVGSSLSTSYLAAVLFSDLDAPSPGFGGATNCAPSAAHQGTYFAVGSSQEALLESWINGGAQP